MGQVTQELPDIAKIRARTAHRIYRTRSTPYSHERKFKYEISMATRLPNLKFNYMIHTF